jgi:hypothetical protein
MLAAAWALPPPALPLPPPVPPLLLLLLLLQAAAPPTVSVRATKTPMVAFGLNIPATPSFEWGYALVVSVPPRRHVAGPDIAAPTDDYTATWRAT